MEPRTEADLPLKTSGTRGVKSRRVPSEIDPAPANVDIANIANAQQASTASDLANVNTSATTASHAIVESIAARGGIKEIHRFWFRGGSSKEKEGVLLVVMRHHLSNESFLEANENVYPIVST